MRKLKLKKIDVVYWFLLAFALLSVIVSFFVSYPVLSVEKIETSFLVGERPGFDLNLTALTFGQVVPGNGASRSLFVDNDYSKPVRVELTASGELVKYLSVSENSFILLPGEEKKVSFSVYAPEDIEFKTYEGVIVIKTTRVSE